MMVTKQEIENLWNKFSEYKDHAEQHEFVKILMIDLKLTPLYSDLMNNWDDHHAEVFKKGILAAFQILGIPYKEDEES